MVFLVVVAFPIVGGEVHSVLVRAMLHMRHVLDCVFMLLDTQRYVCPFCHFMVRIRFFEGWPVGGVLVSTSVVQCSFMHARDVFSFDFQGVLVVVRIWMRESLVNSMLVEVNRLNVVLVVEFMIQNTVRCVIS